MMRGMERVIEILEEEEEEEAQSSAPRTRKQIVRDRIAANERLMEHYFNDDSLYPPQVFRRRFRMQKSLFLRIVNDISAVSEYIRQAPDARGADGFTAIQKCAVAVRQLAYGTVSDSWDEYFQMSERVVRESLEEFCECVIDVYGKRYLRLPTYSDVQALYAHHAQVHGLPGMLGSLDCMHWEWASCPTRLQGQYTRGNKSHPTVILEAVASQDLWIWHAYFGPAGSNNDLNVLAMSPIFNSYCNGTAPFCPFQLRDVTYDYGYYLVDGIYHDYAVFVKSLKFPGDERRERYAKAQERARKDVERAFGALKKRWWIIDKPARPRDKKKLANIMYTCIILHNMILEDENKAICKYVESENVAPSEPLYLSGSPEYIAIRNAIFNNDIHHNLRNDLAEHIWNLRHLDLNNPPSDDTEAFSE